MEFFATCPAGFESLLRDELVSLGTQRVRPLQGRVSFEGDLEQAYRVCLWTHLASRIIAVVDRFPSADANELYNGMGNIAWEAHLTSGSTFCIDASGTNAQLKNTQFVALRAKDAVVDRMVQHTGARPLVNVTYPDLRIVVRISRNHATVGIDLAGDPLFVRGYEQARNVHGLRPDYAAALLALGNWKAQLAHEATALTDASPTPSTILVEAALQAAHCAPGALRVRWGLFGWARHDQQAWDKLVAETMEARRDLRDRMLCLPADSASSATKVNGMLRAAGLQTRIHVMPQEPNATAGVGIVACDLSAIRQEDLAREANALAGFTHLVHALQANEALVATRDQLATRYLNSEPASTVQTRAGQDALWLQTFDSPASYEQGQYVSIAPDKHIPVLASSSEQFASRLKKVARLRAKWARREDVTCYRVYDSDLPDYAVSIELYQGTDPQTGDLSGERWLVISEYAAPKEIDATQARSRLADVLAIAPAVLQVPARNVFLRVRHREKGGSQYAQEGSRHIKTGRRAGDLPAGAHLIDEGGLIFEVNFSSRLDCGIFLDHRETRSMLREMAKETKGSKRFLNLFAYTGTATCFATDGGMLHTTTVDMSRPSLDWARRNMGHNGFVGREHEFVQADVIAWVTEQRHTKNRWDLIFCDVPTSSNSRRMGKRSFDVQRDHAELLIGVSRLLTRNGTCLFSCNLRNFRIDEEKLQHAGVACEDITDQTIPEDFSRNKRIHHAYLVRRVPGTQTQTKNKKQIAR